MNTRNNYNRETWLEASQYPILILCKSIQLKSLSFGWTDVTGLKFLLLDLKVHIDVGQAIIVIIQYVTEVQ